MTALTTARRVLAAILRGPAARCDVHQLWWDVWDDDLADGIFHHGPPCLAPAAATVHTRCTACGHDTRTHACADCAGEGATVPLEFAGVCPDCADHATARYVIAPLS